VTSGQPYSPPKTRATEDIQDAQMADGIKEMVEVRLATIAEFGSPQTSPNGEPKAGPSGCSGSAQNS
jgi:hypothetical protein